MTIKFAHIRPKNNKGQPKTKGGVTIAFQELGDNSWTYSFAFCHKLDNYNKHTGRAKAGGRLLSTKQRMFIKNIATSKDLINILVANLQGMY